MLTNRLINSNLIAIVSITLWLTSLCLTGFSLHGYYQAQQLIGGASILVMGWLGPLEGNFAWYANPFYIYAVLSVLNGNVPFRTTSIALFLSLDTLLFTDYMMNEGGSTTPVYGYGCGALVWFLSLCLLLVAVGTREIEIAKSKNRLSSSPVLILIGISLAIIALGSSVYLHINDRSHANTAELKRLDNVIYKLGNVCSVEQPKVEQPIKDFSGILAVYVTKSTLSTGLSFLQIKEYLNVGITKVRFNGDDYTYEDTKSGKMHVSQSSLSSEQAQAALYITEDLNHNLSVKLIEQASNRVVFNQTWTKESPKSYLIYCPDFFNSAGKEYPWMLLLEALNLNPTSIANF